jgi:hypothetical protein
MSIAYVTYCSAPKREDAEDLPAVERYLSERIASVDRSAAQEGALFLILSGTYGLIERDHPLPWYDHLLAPEEVAPMSERAVSRLASLDLSSVVWFTIDPKLDPFVSRYARVLELATAELGLSLEVRVIEADD